jgi:hypothetical protein
MAAPPPTSLNLGNVSGISRFGRRRYRPGRADGPPGASAQTLASCRTARSARSTPENAKSAPAVEAPASGVCPLAPFRSLGRSPAFPGFFCPEAHRNGRYGMGWGARPYPDASAALPDSEPRGVLRAVTGEAKELPLRPRFRPPDQARILRRQDHFGWRPARLTANSTMPSGLPRTRPLGSSTGSARARRCFRCAQGLPTAQEGRNVAGLRSPGLGVLGTWSKIVKEGTGMPGGYAQRWKDVWHRGYISGLVGGVVRLMRSLRR